MIRKRLYFIGGIFLYIVAGLLIVYSIWAIIHCADIVSQAISSGQLTASGNEYDIISFYMGSCFQYIFYALILGAAGLILQKRERDEKHPTNPNLLTSISENSENDESDVEEWFQDTP